MTKNISVSASSVSVSTENMYKMSAELTEVDVKDLLEYIDIDEAVSHFGQNDLLEYIGKDKIMEFYDLQEIEH